MTDRIDEIRERLETGKAVHDPEEGALRWWRDEDITYLLQRIEELERLYQGLKVLANSHVVLDASDMEWAEIEAQRIVNEDKP